MNIQDCFLILEIEETKDLGKIKSAYYKKLKTVNPEDDPEGFKRLRQAYEGANEYAKKPEEEEPKEEADNTPSGQWMEKVKGLYASLVGRQDLECWKALFQDDIFLSLEDEELCKEKLLIFLMNHIYLPSQIWKLLDNKLHIVKNSEKLQERFPKQFIDFCVFKCKQGENLNFTMFVCEDDADIDNYLYYYDSGYRMLEQGDYAAARQAYEEGAKCSIYHPLMDIMYMHLLEAEEKTEEQLEVLQQLLEKYRDADVVQYQCAESLFKLGKREEAGELYEMLKETSNKHYMANYRLASIYYSQGEYKKAKKCAEVVLEHGSDEDFRKLLQKINVELKDEYKSQVGENGDIAMEYGWCLIQNEEYFAGIKLAADLEGKVPEDREVERKGLLAKLYVQEALYDKALEMALIWRNGLWERLPRQTGEDKTSDIRRIKDSYFLRIQAYHALGGARKECYENALKEIDEVIAFVEEYDEQGDVDVTVYLEKAQILLEMERFDDCEKQCLEVWKKYRMDAVYSIMLKLAARQRDAGGVIQFGENCIEAFPQYIAAYEEMALVYLCLDKKEELEELLKRAKEAEVKSVFLDAYDFQLRNSFEKVKYPDEIEDFEKDYKRPITANGNMSLYEEGLKQLTQLFYRSPSIYLLNELGRFYMDTLHYAEAEETFKKILAEQPYDQFALNNLGCIYKYTRRDEKAIVCFNKAILYMDEEPNTYPYGNGGHTYERMGEYQQAAKTYLALVERFPDRKEGTLRDIITCRARSGNLEAALKLIEEGYQGKRQTEGLQFAVELCIELDNEEQAKGYQAKLEKKVSDVSAAKQQADVLKNQAELEMLYGDYFKGLKLAKECCEKGMKFLKDRRVKTVDVVGDLTDFLFYTTLYADAAERFLGYSPQKKGIKSWFAGLMGEKCAVSEKLLEQWRQWAYHSVDELMMELCTPTKDKYFYQQKNKRWEVFMAGYFKEGNDPAAAYQHICDGITCRFCSENCCVEELTAQALVLEKEGKRQEAIALYEALQKKNPFQIYARCKLRFMSRNKGSN